MIQDVNSVELNLRRKIKEIDDEIIGIDKAVARLEERKAALDETKDYLTRLLGDVRIEYEKRSKKQEKLRDAVISVTDKSDIPPAEDVKKKKNSTSDATEPDSREDRGV